MIPLFHTSAEDVARQLRLQNLRGGGTGGEMFEAALDESRTTFWKYLGQARLDTLAAITPNATPQVEDDYLYLMAKQVEVDLTRFHLAARMPLAFRDGKLEFLESYQSDGAFKRLSQEQTVSARNLWWSDPESGILSKFNFLSGGFAAKSDRVILREIADEEYIDLRQGFRVFTPVGDLSLDDLLVTP